jgi:hypothetical protein
LKFSPLRSCPSKLAASISAWCLPSPRCSAHAEGRRPEALPLRRRCNSCAISARQASWWRRRALHTHIAAIMPPPGTPVEEPARPCGWGGRKRAARHAATAAPCARCRESRGRLDGSTIPVRLDDPGPELVVPRRSSRCPPRDRRTRGGRGRGDAGSDPAAHSN